MKTRCISIERHVMDTPALHAHVSRSVSSRGLKWYFPRPLSRSSRWHCERQSTPPPASSGNQHMDLQRPRWTRTHNWRKRESIHISQSHPDPVQSWVWQLHWDRHTKLGGCVALLEPMRRMLLATAGAVAVRPAQPRWYCLDRSQLMVQSSDLV